MTELLGQEKSVMMSSFFDTICDYDSQTDRHDGQMDTSHQMTASTELHTVLDGNNIFIFNS